MWFTYILRTTIYFQINKIVDFPITYRKCSVLCQSECAYLHKRVNMVVFFAKRNENTYPKGRAFMHMYRVVSITKRGNTSFLSNVYVNTEPTKHYQSIVYIICWVCMCPNPCPCYHVRLSLAVLFCSSESKLMVCKWSYGILCYSLCS